MIPFEYVLTTTKVWNFVLISNSPSSFICLDVLFFFLTAVGKAKCTANPLGEGFLFPKSPPTEVLSLSICLHDDRTVLQSAVGQEYVVICAFHRDDALIYLRRRFLRSGMPFCG